MIRKFLLIGEGGILSYYLSQDGNEIDGDLLSGFCRALYDVSLELTFPLKTVGFEKNKMIVESIEHSDNNTLLVAMIYEEHHIDEAIKNKIHYIYDRFFKFRDFKDTSKIIKDRDLDRRILDIINDVPLKVLVDKNIETIKEILDPILLKRENSINAYSITSSNNTLLYSNGTYQLSKYRQELSVEQIITEYLLFLKQEKIPHGDKFIGLDLSEGLDLEDYINTGQKTHGVVINTSINLKDEPDNELLLYFFGKNTLMRSCVLDIEHTLRYKLEEIEISH
ncbi:MAG: hypothetical protein JW891_12150 [Candidatus Lokiarchaeota archaeon]|nr:hypothetical protein [Candidatus Lokiarchaeota archaeon]